jgi:hypothetical protein
MGEGCRADVKASVIYYDTPEPMPARRGVQAFHLTDIKPNDDQDFGDDARSTKPYLWL